MQFYGHLTIVIIIFFNNNKKNVIKNNKKQKYDMIYMENYYHQY